MNARLKSSRYMTAAAFVLLSTAAFAQAPSLDTPVHDFKLPRQLRECEMEAVLQRVAQNTGIAIGFERKSTAECHGHRYQSFFDLVRPLDLDGADVLDDVPVKDVLARIAAKEPDYDWAIMEGVAVFRPASAWKDAGDPLFARVGAMRFSDTAAVSIVGALLHWPIRASETRPHRTSLDFAGGTVLDGLNALVRAHPAMWYVSSNDERLFVDLWFSSTNDGFGVAPPLARLSKP